jgi:hypothetical protein
VFRNKPVNLLVSAPLMLFLVSSACCTEGAVTTPGDPGAADAHIESLPGRPTPTKRTQVVYDYDHTDSGLLLDSGGDVDTVLVTVGSPPEYARRTGNGLALSSEHVNRIGDSYMQFNVDDTFIFEGSPTSRVQIEIEYLDEGTDTFNVQYDAISGGPFGDGRFKDTGVVVKTGSKEFKTAVLTLCDATFANRDNGGDFRIADRGDGAETIRRVTVTRLASTPGPVTIHVDSCGADPFDEQPDSDAIQACINQACSGDTVFFTSGGGDPDYRGYIIDKTVFLVHPVEKHDLTFTSTDPNDHALLTASPDLLGFVVRLYARSQLTSEGKVDNITFMDLDLDGNRAERICSGKDEIRNGVDDNWGSWLPECDQPGDEPGDAWCTAGTLAMGGYLGEEDSSTGLVVQDVTIANTECGTALVYHGGEGMIDSVVVDTAGDHVHASGCQKTDPDESIGAWSDGITFGGWNNAITNNTIINASDIGIVCFACTNTTIANNHIIAEPGNHGMFAGIALHPYWSGGFSGIEITNNRVTNKADGNCGGIHAGINLGNHMWSAGCTDNPSPSAIGTIGPCKSISPPPPPTDLLTTTCDPDQPCRLWGYVPRGEALTLTNNVVTGAQVNFLIEGVVFAGQFVEYGNISVSPRMTDWEGDQGCTWDGITDSWGAIDFVAHDPTIAGWTDQRIYCTR